MHYSALSLVKQALSGNRGWTRAWRNPEPKKQYDVIIIGGGGHGLATAYYLAKLHGITNVAVLEKGYIGGGNTGRNTTIVRSNYQLKPNSQFYEHSMKLWEGLSQELNYNVMFSQRGVLNLFHTDAQRDAAVHRGNAMHLNGVDAKLLDLDGVRKLMPHLDFSSNTRFPVIGGLSQPRGGTARHDAVAWGFARGADALGVEIHQGTKVEDIEVTDGRVSAVETNRGRISTPIVINCTAGWCTLVSEMAGVTLPISTAPLQAAVTEPVKFFLDPVVVSGSLHVYVSQTDRGELVFGASVDPYASYSTRGSLEFTEGLAEHILQLMPSVAKMRLLRQWAGLCDMTPDYSPIMGATPVDGFFVDVGWGTYGFKAGPVAGESMAACIATGKAPDLIAPFNYERFAKGTLMGEKGAASVGH